MTWDEAVEYCETHECAECDVYTKNLDKRTDDEKKLYHELCCSNLVTEENK